LLRSFILSFIGAVAWTIAAVVVAFPDFALNLKFGELAQAFVKEKETLSVSLVIPLLLLIDILIGIFCLADENMDARFSHPKSSGLVLLLGIAYVSIVQLVPSYVEGAADNWAGTLTLLACSCVTWARWLTYAKPRIFSDVATVVNTPEPDDDDEETD